MELAKKPELRYLAIYVFCAILLSLILLIWGIPFFRTLQASLGLPFVLFIPGYLFTLILFKKIDMIERLALSFALSIALVTLTVIFTNTLLKIPITPISNFLIILTIIVIEALVLGLRR